MCSCLCTSVVHISRDLNITHLRVHWEFIEVFVPLKREFSSEWHWVPVLIHRVDQQGVKVVKLDKTAEDDMIIHHLMMNN